MSLASNLPLALVGIILDDFHTGPKPHQSVAIMTSLALITT